MNKIILTLVFSLSSLISDPTYASDALEPNVDKFDPRAQEIIRRMSTYYKQVDSFTFDLSSRSSFKAQGVNEEYIDDYQIAINHPNRLAVTSKGDSGGTVVCDGQNLFAFAPDVGKYTLTQAPDSFDDIATGEAPFIMGSSAVVFNVCAADPSQRIMDGVSGIELLEDDTIGEVQCHRIRLLHEEVSIEMWIQAGAQPLLRKIVPDMSSAMPNDGPLGEVSIETVINLGNWVMNGAIPKERFEISPPEGAEEIDSFFRAASDGERVHPLVGQQAPDFELNTLEGDKVNLADHKGKNIVIVDFWATWCGPCIEAIPILIEVAKEFSDRNVVLYSVNQQEDPAFVREYIKNQNWDFDVLADLQSDVARKYAVTGLPQTVIIDKQGKVQAVHIGFGFGLQERLTSELEAIIAGEDLAGRNEK